MSRRWSRRIAQGIPYAVILLIAAAALALRSVDLEHRPVHGDEANQAYKAGKLLETGRYVYDPHDHHGPTLYYLALIPFYLTGTNSLADAETWMVRIVPVVFGACLIALLALVRHEIGTGSAICSGLLLLASPAFTFYSRYFIQETLLVFFTFAAIVCALRYLRNPGLGWAVAFGTSISLMHATKETAILAYTAMAMAGIVVWLLHGRKTDKKDETARPSLRHGAAAIGVAVVLNLILFSAFFTHWRGPLDSLLTYANYLDRASGNHIHDKPWYYYLSLLWYTKRAPGPWWSEGHVLLMGLAGMILAFLRQPREREDTAPFARFLAVYTLLLGIAYSIIPYKTPWSILSCYFGIVLLAGMAVSRAVHVAPAGWRRALVIIAFGLVLTHLGAQSWRAETVYAADIRNPYVYAHTSTALVRFVEQVEGIAASSPSGRSITIKIVQPDADYWPLPWYLRRYPNLHYIHGLPENADADIVIVDPQLVDSMQAKFHDAYFGPFTAGLRPGVLRAVFVRQALWEAYMDSRVAAPGN